MSWGIEKRVLIALLGEVPPTLRFLYVDPKSDDLCFHAVFTNDATDDHLNCAEVVCNEIDAGGWFTGKGGVLIEKNESIPWKKGDGKHLMYLRYGELLES